MQPLLHHLPSLVDALGHFHLTWLAGHILCCSISISMTLRACVAAGEEAGSTEEAAEVTSAPPQNAVLLLSVCSVCSCQGVLVVSQAPHHPDPAAPSNHRLRLPQADRCPSIPLTLVSADDCCSASHMPSLLEPYIKQMTGLLVIPARKVSQCTASRRMLKGMYIIPSLICVLCTSHQDRARE